MTSNSNSNDRIEEAVQVYQLQKTRKEANGDMPCPQRAQLWEERELDSRTQHKQRHKNDRSLSASPLFYSPNVPSRSDGDSSSVDSDGSVEQEIWTVLTPSDRSLSASPLFYYPSMPSRCDGDSCSMDSEEQEIRTSLTLKAQWGGLLVRGENCPQAASGPLSPPGHNRQTSGPKPPSKTLNLPLDFKRNVEAAAMP
ncbi:hypothetical protein P7K49_000479 [Saguinus oedipus]|uniref:Protein phosphatase 1 regulatory subunit 26 N-terminal domain-containing protein n=1 Tax=Saguinus oedipus TaxID=9490 RepID=A0ABQ9WEA9_SAGOE|nr:hypothetical protein P7K49_000479 [Saguinus oedipus]